MTNRAAPDGSMRYFALLYAPEQHREAIMALYVIDAEIRESAQSVNHDVAHTRLRWWRAEIDRLVNRNPQHPATRVLLERCSHLLPAFERLHELLSAADMDLARMTYLNERELRAYSVRSGGIVQELIARVLRQELDEPTRAAALSIGVGIRQAEMVRDVRLDAVCGRIYVPLDSLERHGLHPQALAAASVSENLKEALRELTTRAQDELRLPMHLDRELLSTLRPLWVLAGLHDRLLTRIAARRFEIATERIELGPIEKPWVAWRVARRTR